MNLLIVEERNRAGFVFRANVLYGKDELGSAAHWPAERLNCHELWRWEKLEPVLGV